jgi:hypothetical protein
MNNDKDIVKFYKHNSNHSECQEISKKTLLSKIWGFQGGDYDDYHLLGGDAVWLL